MYKRSSGFFPLLLTGLLVLIQMSSYAQVHHDSLLVRLHAFHYKTYQYLGESLRLMDSLKSTPDAGLILEIKDTALLAAEHLGDTSAIVRIYSDVGDYYWKTAQLAKAAEAFNEIRLLAELTGHPEWRALSYNGLGTVYYLTEDYDNAILYYRSAEQLIHSDTVLLMRLYNNIANVMAMTGQMDSVFYYYHQVREFDEQTGNLSKLSNTYLNLSTAYFRTGDEKSSRAYANQALDAAKKSGDPVQQAWVFSNLGSLYIDRDHDRARAWFHEARKHAVTGQAHDLVIMSDDALRYLYETHEQYDSALFHAVRALYYQDSLVHDQTTDKIKEVEVGFEWAVKKMAEEEDLHQQELARLKKNNQTRMLLTFSWLVLVFLLVVLYLLYQSNRTRKQINEQLALSNATKDRFFGLIAHDLRSPVSGAVSLSEVISEELRDSRQAELSRYAQVLHVSLLEVQSLMENLLQWAQHESGKIRFHPEEITLRNLVEDTLPVFAEQILKKSMRLVNSVPADLTLYADKNMMQTILRNLLSNAIKFTPANGEIQVTALTKPGETEIRVSDNGLGMDAKMVQQLLEATHVISTPGTSNEKGSGLGMQLCRDFVKWHKGRLDIQSEPGQGTTVLIFIPHQQ